MSAISLKSITGITSITTPAGVDNQLTLHTNNTTERLRIESDGRVAIGTDSANARLRIHNDSDDSAIVWLSGADVTSEYLSFGIQSGLAVLRGGGTGSTSCALSFETSTSGTESEKMRLDANGILKLGTGLTANHVNNAPSDVKFFLNSGRGSYGGLATNAIIFDNQTAAVDAGGTLTLAGFTGSGAIAKAAIRGGNEGSASTNNGYFAVFTRPVSGNLSERLRITSDGKVGINKSDPEALLHIHNSGTSVLPLKVYRNDVGDTPIAHFQAYNNTVGVVDKFVVTSRGRVGVNTDNPQREIHVKPSDNNPATAVPGYIRIEGQGSNQPAILELYHTRGNGADKWPVSVGTDDAAMTFNVATGNNGSPQEKVRIDSSGRVLIGTNASRTTNSHTPALQISGVDYHKSTVQIINNANDSTGAYLFFGKQRSGSVGGNTIAVNGDIVGQLRFSVADGTDMENQCAQIEARVDGTPGSNDTPGRLQFYTTPDNSTALTERLRITSGGSVNIGGDYSQTSQKLKVTGNTTIDGTLTAGIGFVCAGGYSIFSGNVTQQGYTFHDADSDTYFGFSSNDQFAVFTAGTQRLKIFSNGNSDFDVAGGTLKVTGTGAYGLSIHNTNSPSMGHLYIYGDNGLIRFRNSSNTYTAQIGYSESSNSLFFANQEGGTTLNIVDDGVQINDNEKFLCGNDKDLALYHNNSDAYIDNTTGALIFRTTGSNTERLRITSGGVVNIGTNNLSQTTYKAQIETGTNKFISFTNAAHDDLSDEGSAIIFSRPSDGAKLLSGIFEHSNTSFGIATRSDLTFHAGGTSTYSAAPERLRITSDGNMYHTSDAGRIFSTRNFGEAGILIGSGNAGGATLYLDGDSNGDWAGGDYAYIRHNVSGHLDIVSTNPNDDGQITFNTGAGTYVGRISSTGVLQMSGGTNSRAIEINPGGNAGTMVLDRNGYLTSMIRSSDGGSNVGGPSGGGSRLQLAKNQIYMYTFPYVSNVGDSVNYQQRFRIDTSGNFHGSSSNNISDQRLKKDIAAITNPLTKIKALTGRTFKWKEDSTKFDDKTKYGFIAQEVETSIPELVDSEHGIILFDKDDKVIYDEDAAVSRSKAVNETGVIPITVEALKVLISKVETLEAKVAALEGS